MLKRALLLCALLVAAFAAAGPAYADAGFEQRVLELTNAERAGHGLPPLVLSHELTASARGYAASMAAGGFFAHVGPDGSTMKSRNEAAGYHGWTFLAENLAGGQSSPERAVAGWMNSPGHRANILDGRVREIGIGHVYSGGTRFGHHWVQEFGARSAVPVVSRTVSMPAPSAPAPAGVGGCQFVHGFKLLRDHIPGTVGGCVENEHHNPANGDALQRTSGGMLAWRKADNFTAFTDGFRTWVNGPYGIQQRLNTQRFPWEAR